MIRKRFPYTQNTTANRSQVYKVGTAKMKKIIALMATGIMLTCMTASAQLDDATYKAKIAALTAEYRALEIYLPKTPEDQKAAKMRIAALPKAKQYAASQAPLMASLKINRCFLQINLLTAEQQGNTADIAELKKRLARVESDIARLQRSIDAGKPELPKTPITK